MRLTLNARTTLCIFICTFIVYSFGASADVVGTLSAGTDWILNIVRAALALIIIYCCALGLRGGGILPIVGVVICAAAMLESRTIAGWIQ